MSLKLRGRKKNMLISASFLLWTIFRSEERRVGKERYD